MFIPCEDPRSDSYWEDCTTPSQAIERIKKIGDCISKYSSSRLKSTFCDKTIRILEVGCGNGIFMKELQDQGFHNISGADRDRRYVIRFPELKGLVHPELIQSMTFAAHSFDLVISNLIFDSGNYPNQKKKGYQRKMLQGIHQVLRRDGLYFASEDHDQSELKKQLGNIRPRADTFLTGPYQSTGVFLKRK